MNKPQWLSCTLSAMLISAATAGLNGTALAEEELKTDATAPATEESTTQDTPQGTAQDTTQATRSYRDRGRYGWRRGHDRYAEQRKAIARARHNEMERWRRMRRWWNNPEAEDRRMWNKARSRTFRDMAEARRSYHEQFRPPRDYRYREWHSYRSGPWY